MTVNLGLDACDMEALWRAFGLPHRIRRSVRILNLDHTLIQDVTSTFTDGQVNVDSRANPSRTATVSLFDPTRLIGIDTASPDRGVVAPRYLLELHRGIYVDELTRWVDIPAGVLWFTKPTRAGDILSIEAQGKEEIANYPVEKQLTFTASANKMSVIRDIMESIGETRFRLDSTTEKLGTKLVVDVSMTPWQACKIVADGMSRQLFYDAEGYVVCRKRPANPVFRFRCGNDGTVRTEPQITYADGKVYNLVRGTGATPEGKDIPISASSRVPSTHPLYLTRNGKFVPLRFDASNDKLTTVAAVKSMTDNQLDEVVKDSQAATWDSHPVPLLEQGDPVILTDAIDDHGTSSTFAINVALGTFSFPLTLGPQSNGYLRRVSRSTNRIVRTAA